MALQNNSVCLNDVLPLILEQLAAGRSVRYYPRGTSMLPLLRQGIDSVELSPVPQTLKPFDLPFYTRRNGQHVMHRIISAGSTYTCMGDNQFEKEPGIAHGQVFALVTAIYRGDRRIPVTAVSYRLYSRLWHCFRPLRKLYLRSRALGGRLLRRLGLYPKKKED